jgi:hypothetical protein
MENVQFVQIQAKLAGIVNKIENLRCDSENSRRLSSEKKEKEIRILKIRFSNEIQQAENEFIARQKEIYDSRSYRLRRAEGDYDSTIKFLDDKRKELRIIEVNIRSIVADPQVLSRISILDRSTKVESMKIDEIKDQIVALMQRAQNILEDYIKEHKR